MLENISPTAWIFIGILFCVQIYFTIDELRDILFMLLSSSTTKNWLSTTGVIVSSERSYKSKLPYIYFQYRVQDRDYKNNTIAPGPIPGGTYGKAMVKKYPAGATAQVFYDPEDPSQSVLERKGPILLSVITVVILNVVLFGAEIIIALTH